MRIASFLLMCLFVTTTASAQLETGKQIFKAPDFKDSLEKHKVVAILPFKATIAYKRMPK